MKDLIFKFIEKYTITFLSILLFALFSTNMLTSSITDFMGECFLLSINLVYGSFMLYKLIDLYKQKLPSKVINNSLIVNSIIIIVPIVLFYISKSIIGLYINKDGNTSYYLLVVFNLIIFFTILKEKNINMGEYISKIFFNFLFLLLSYIVVLTGIAILTFIYEALFNYIYSDFILGTYAFISSMLLNVGYLISIEKTDTKQSLFSKILIKYVMMTMVLIGFFFFYVYLVSIIISMKMPSNQVFLVCTVLFTIGLIISLMSKYYYENDIYDIIIDKMPIIYIPALCLQILSIIIRIANYGMTSARYFGILIVIFEIAYIVLYIFKYDKLKYIFIVVTTLYVLTLYIPFTNIFQFPIIYNKFFNQNSYNENLVKIKYIENSEEVSGDKRYDLYEKDIEGYKKSYTVHIDITYNVNEDVWYNSDNKDKAIPNLYLVDVYTHNHKFITTIDISDYLKTIENNIIKYDYKSNSEKIFENTVNSVHNLDKKLYIKNIIVYYSKNTKTFNRIILNGELLTKK